MGKLESLLVRIIRSSDERQLESSSDGAQGGAYALLAKFCAQISW